jgi:DNA modification methylase
MTENLLYYGDNLEVMRRYIADESVDLIYLDPPFNSNVDYNVLFKEREGDKAASQIKAFKDSWTWTIESEREFVEVIERAPSHRVVQCIDGLKAMLGTSDMLAYLVMMANRLIELKRALKPTGSIYLHCDPTASHYLKLVMDAVFGPQYFRSEIIWKRSSAHSDTKQGRKQHGRIHDVILFYTRSDEWQWNPIHTPYDEEYVNSFYRHVDSKSGRRYRLGDLTAARPGGDTLYEWRVKRKANGEWLADLEDEHLKPKRGWEYKGVKPYKGRIWAYSRENMRKMAAEGRIQHTGSGFPNYVRYLDEMSGVPLQDLWTDIKPIGAGAAERLGYPTQKPQALLERIINASSNPGDVVLDPFCGCGTTVAAAQALGRSWIGIDITYLAINLIKVRLQDQFDGAAEYKSLGEPVSVPDAEKLARENPYQFQWWALGKVGARPFEQKKGSDKGIDGRLYFHDEGAGGKTKQIIFSVKAGKVGVDQLRDLRGVIDREEAAIGVFISMNEPTKAMRTEAASAGFYDSPGWNKSYPRLQLLTVEDLLAGKAVDMPPSHATNITFKKAPKAKRKGAVNKELTFGGADE